MKNHPFVNLMVAPFILQAIACNDPPRPSPTITAPMAAPAAPAQVPPGAPPLGPVAPGQYVNHVGNPAAGSWGPDGQWQWKDPESKEANDTWKFLAAAGAGAAGGAALSYMLSKNYFERKHPSGTWQRESNIHDEHNYRDRHGKAISAAEYERRRAQSERDRAAHRARVQAAQQSGKKAPGVFSGSQPSQYRDKKGRFISKQEFERRQAQSARDKSRHRSQSRSRNNNRQSRRRR